MKLSAAQQHVLNRMVHGWDLYPPSEWIGQWRLASPVLQAERMPFRYFERVPTATFKKLVALGCLTPHGELTEKGRELAK